MNAFELSAHIAACLEEDGLEYAIGGALALTAWAIPRDTKDVDISVFAASDRLDRVFDALERAGVMVERAEAIRSVARIGMFTARSGRTLVDVFVGEHPHFDAMRQRRTQLAYPGGAPLWFLSAEDLCVLKLLYGRTKDVADVERLLAAIPELDLAYVRDWLAKLPHAERKQALFEQLVSRFRDR